MGGVLSFACRDQRQAFAMVSAPAPGPQAQRPRPPPRLPYSLPRMPSPAQWS